MGPGGAFVHVGGGDGSAVSGDFYELVDFVGGGDVLFGDIFDEDSSFFIGSDLQIWLVMVQKIPQLLHVKLGEGYLYSKLDILVGFGDSVEDVFNHSWDNAWPFVYDFSDVSFHGVGFAGGSLSISEDSAIESFDDAVDDGGSRVVVDFFLWGLAVKHFVKGELKGFFGVLEFSVFDLYCFIVEQLMAEGSA